MKINLITAHEQSQLDKLREIYRFYLDNGGREIRQRKIQRALKICRDAIDLAEAITKALSAQTDKTNGSIKNFRSSTQIPEGEYDFGKFKVPVEYRCHCFPHGNIKMTSEGLYCMECFRKTGQSGLRRMPDDSPEPKQILDIYKELKAGESATDEFD